MHPTTITASAVVLRRRPAGPPTPEDLELVDQRLEPSPPGHVLVAVAYLSVDPYVRSVIEVGHLTDPPLPVGAVLPGRSVGVVLESDAPGVPVGRWVLAESGWRTHASVPAESVSLVDLPADLPPSAALGALGMPGLTAYAAVTRHLRPRPGETVVVSSGTGGVGTAAGAFARAAGARTVAVVGSTQKGSDARELGYDEAVVRHGEHWEQALADACPDGIDGYIHMGDQATLAGAVRLLSVGARVSLCGLVGQESGARVALDAGAVMSARAVVHGMVVYDHLGLRPEFLQRAGELASSGVLRIHEDRHVGLDSAPAALARLIAGDNRGKVVVVVDEQPS